MAKATHYGHCQCCGARQKLPNGVLSKHGYTVEHGWFNGICPGAGHLPFEQDTSLIETFIKNAQDHIERVKHEIQRLEESTDSEFVWHCAYIDTVMARKLHCKSGYKWEQRRLEMKELVYEDYTVTEFHWVYSDDEVKPRGHHATRAIVSHRDVDTMDEAVKYLNNLYIKQILNPQITGTTSYITWQQKRIKNWKPAELEAV